MFVFLDEINFKILFVFSFVKVNLDNPEVSEEMEKLNQTKNTLKDTVVKCFLFVAVVR